MINTVSNQVSGGPPSGRELPQFVRDILSSPPPRGEGLNLWLFRAARVLWPYRTEGEIVAALAAAVAGEPLQSGEIERAVARSKDCAWTPTTKPRARGRSAWPQADEEARRAIIKDAPGVFDLMKASPMQFEPRSYAEEIADILFPGNPLLCVGKSNSVFATRLRETWRGRLSEMALIVPSPMLAKSGRTQEGKISEHALENTGPRRFLVVEQDRGTRDEQAAIVLHLAQKAPLSAVVFSGSKSLHAWFFCQGQKESRLRDFMVDAVRLGADRATWTRSQFVRLPGGRRDNGNHQEVIYLNPETISL